MSQVKGGGRLGNTITRNIAGSIIAKKHNLKITYQDYQLITQIGIPLFSGIKIYKNTNYVDDNNYFQILNANNIDFNINVNSYSQTKQITDETHKYLNSSENIEPFVNNNKYKDRYNNNNDCFIHIRLGDVSKWNPGFKYYDYVLSKLKYDNIYIATDSNNHIIIREIQNKYKNVNIMDDNIINIFQFGSTCRYVILSYGTFSAMIGYLSFYSTVYCLKFCKKIAWDWNATDECDMFRNKTTTLGEWIEIDIIKI
jgi:hypothetical protein